MTVISSSLRKEIVRRLVNEFQPEAVYLFGSYAWGKPDEESDLDILVILPESAESPIQLATRAQRSLRGVRAGVDVLVKTRNEFEQFRPVKASLEAKIASQGKLLYGSKAFAGA